MAAKKRRKAAAAPVHAEPPPRTWPPVTRWLGPGLIAAVFVALAADTWMKWPDVLVDFGQQLYIPWRIAQGDRLYRDIFLLHGPLSQHVNAIWFLIFGPSLTVLVVVNLVIFAGLTAVAFRIVQIAADRLTATVAALILLCWFGFSQYVGTGNYNCITPYVHEATHGMILTAAMILLFIRYLTSGGRGVSAAAGLCLGLALLTKVDVAIAALAVAALALAMAFFRRAIDSTLRVDVLAFAGAAIAPGLLFFAYFLTYLPFTAAARAVGGGFAALSNDVANNPFYAKMLGVDDIPGNLLRMGTMLLLIAGFVLVAAVIDVAARRLTRHSLAIGTTLGLALFAVLILQPSLVAWRDLPRALPVTTALTLAVFLVLFFRHGKRTDDRPGVVAMILWTTFALALLTKMVLNAQIYRYGFYLAMPATLALVTCLTFWIPRLLTSRYRSGLVFRALTLGVLAAATVYHVRWSEDVYRLKTFAIGHDGDRMWTYSPDVWPPTSITASALHWIDRNMPATATFAALPEGITLNYLSRRETTLPEMNLMMTEMLIFGEGTILAGIETRPPDYVLLVDKDTSEFGVGPFGADPRYGRKIMDWINQHYAQAALFGAEPFQGRGFGIKILRRNR